jgi:hypothetical protein
MEAQCLKRELNGEDIARVVLFLASDEAGAITGQHSSSTPADFETTPGSPLWVPNGRAPASLYQACG